MKKLAAAAISALALLALGAPAYAGKPAKKDCGPVNSYVVYCVSHGLHTSGRFPVAERLAEERALRPLPRARFDWSGLRIVRVPLDGYLRHGRCFYRAPERLVHQRVELRF